jgi:hypothetical protein
MIIGANTGPALLADGTQNAPARSDRLGGLYVVEGRARYAENTRRGLRMVGANQAAVTTSAGLSTTNTGLILFNPVGSTVNLEVDKLGLAFIVAFAAGAAIGLQGGFAGAALAGVTVDGQYNALVNGPVGQGLIYKAATTVAPVIKKSLGSGLTGAITTIPALAPVVIDLEGSVVVPPGGWLSLYTSTASGASACFASIEWTEVTI